MERRPIAAVTGARQGIGRGIAFALAEAGFDVIALDLVEDEPAAETLAGLRERGAGAAFVTADIAEIERREAVADALFAAFGTLDCLVNNAGVQVKVRGDLLDVTPESYDRVMGINLRGTFFLTFSRRRLPVAWWRRNGPRAGRIGASFRSHPPMPISSAPTVRNTASRSCRSP
jgi:NAD(P)-dependent dehydrogenase (short-subunit alcohol dehydrogenase family)